MMSTNFQPTAVTAAEWRLMMAMRLMLKRCPHEAFISTPWWPTMLTPVEWYWMVAARLTLEYFTDQVPALETALAPILDLVDAAMAEVAIDKCEMTVQLLIDLEGGLDKKVFELEWRRAIQAKKDELAARRDMADATPDR